MRRILSVGVVIFVAGAFTLAVVTEGKGWLFIGSMIAAAGMLIMVVFLMAFSGGRENRPEGVPDGYLRFEEAARHALGGGGFESPGRRDASGILGAYADEDQPRASARAFVRALVPVPRPSSMLTAAAARHEQLAALKREGTGLIRLAKVTGVDVAPYQAFLADARKAALRGDANATLRALQLANELLRASIEKFLIKRKAAGQGMDDFASF